MSTTYQTRGGRNTRKRMIDDRDDDVPPTPHALPVPSPSLPPPSSPEPVASSSGKKKGKKGQTKQAKEKDVLVEKESEKQQEKEGQAEEPKGKDAKRDAQQKDRQKKEAQCKYRAALFSFVPVTPRHPVMGRHVYYKEAQLVSKVTATLTSVDLKEGYEVRDYATGKSYTLGLMYLSEGGAHPILLCIDANNNNAKPFQLSLNSTTDIVKHHDNAGASDAMFQGLVDSFKKEEKAKKKKANKAKLAKPHEQTTVPHVNPHILTNMQNQLDNLTAVVQSLTLSVDQCTQMLKGMRADLKSEVFEFITKTSERHDKTLIEIVTARK